MIIRKSYLMGFLLATFLMGAAVGTVYDSLAGDGSGTKRRGHLSMMSELHQKLDMTEAQKARLDQVLEDGREQMMELGRLTRPRYQKIRTGLRDQIRSILTPGQALEFDRLMDEHDQRRKQRHDRRQGALDRGTEGCRGT